MARNKVEVGDISDVSGEVTIAGRDIINTINTINQRALTAAEEAERARKMESKLLAQGVSEFAQSLAVQASQGMESDSPYKGLLSYNLNEAEIFYGRNAAKKGLLNCINQDRLTVLHAESGAGKSSLLQAGIAAQLIANGHLAVYLRPHNADPVDFIKRMFLPKLTLAPILTKASLHDFLRQVCVVIGAKVNLYLLLDQFEEFFHLLKKEDRTPFLESFEDCLNDSSLNVRWVLALRAEAFSELAELESFGIKPFKNTYRLNLLNRTEAIDAIKEPARKNGITFEQELIDYILNTLITNDEITPTHLQLVCSALMENLPEDKILTVPYFIEHEGGTEGILRDYLKRQLEHLPADEQIFAWKVLRALITADRQRAVKTHDEIVEELKVGGVSKKQIDIILGRLIERRLLFTQPATTEKFELAHDYLIKEIELDPKEQTRKAAQELLDQEVRAYLHHKTLLTKDRLAIIEPHLSELRFSPKAKKFLEKSRQEVQKERHSRELRRKRMISGIAIALLSIIAVLAGWLITSKEQNIKIKEQQLYAQSLLNQDSTLDINLLQWAEKLDDIPEARFGLSSYLQKNYSPIKQRIWPEPTGWIFTLDINPDHNILVAGRRDGRVDLWDANTLQAFAPLQGPKALVHYVEFSPSGELLAASFDDPPASVYLWNMIDKKLLIEIPTGGRWVKSIAFNPDESLMAISLDSLDQIQLWDITNLSEIHLYEDLPILSNLNGRAASISFSPDGSLLAAGLMGTTNNTVRFWNTIDWHPVCPLLNHKGWIYSIDFNLSGDLLAAAGNDGRISIWDPKSCRLVGYMDGHSEKVQSVNFSPDGNIIVSSSFDTTVRIWDVEKLEQIGMPLMGHNFIVNDAIFGKNDKTIFSGSLDNSLIKWDLNQTDSFDRQILNSHASVEDLLLSNNDEMLVALTADGRTRIWNTLDYEPLIIPILENIIVKKIALNSESELLGILDDTNKIQVLEIKTGLVGVTYNIDSIFDVHSMTFAPDNERLVMAGKYNKLISLNINTGIQQEIFGVEEDQCLDFRAVVFSPDGNYMATGNTKGSITLWDGQGLKPIASRIHAHQDWITDLVFSSDGKFLASTSYDGHILIWDAKTLDPIGAPLTGHNSHVFSLAFSANQPTLISGSADKSITWWSLDNHMIIGKLNSGDSSSVTNVSISKDDKFIISSTEAGNIFVWRMDDTYLMSVACKIVGRNFLQSEWKQYFPNEEYHKTCPQWPSGQ